MKSQKLILITVAFFLSLAAFSQTDSTKTDTTTTTTDSTERKDSTNVGIQNGSSSVTTSQSQSTENQQQFPAPNFGRYYIPVLGKYQSSQADAETKTVTITGDETNPGKVWIEGLAPAKFFALLKAVPGTYKVPAQKQDEKNIQEGTIVYDETSKNISICLGCGYKNPSDATAATDESKEKHNSAKAVINFTGIKTDQGTAQTK